jgi:hypothetical protein
MLSSGPHLTSAVSAVFRPVNFPVGQILKSCSLFLNSWSDSLVLFPVVKDSAKILLADVDEIQIS